MHAMRSRSPGPERWSRLSPVGLHVPAPRSLVTTFCTAVIVWVAFSLTGQQLSRAYAMNNDLTDTGDAYSEANDARAGEGYATMGLTSNYGLPDAGFGTQYEHLGGKHDPLLCKTPQPCVYLHYPPGPELGIGVMTTLFGKGRMFVYRLLPITLGLLSLLGLGAALYKALGPVRAAAVMWLIGGVPMTSNMMHVIALHEYALAFFFIELAVLLYTFSQPITRTWHVVAVGIAAFLEGWTAFDYVFLVALAPLAVFLAFKEVRNPVSRRRLMLLTLTAAGAYAFANVLHFLQVAAFLGGVREAFFNFLAAGKNRTAGPTWVHPPISGAAGLLTYYWVHLLPKKEFYDGTFVALVAVVFALLWPKRTSITLGRWGSLVWTSTWAHLASFLLMLALCSGWIIVMQQHASIHGHFLPRLYTSGILWAYVLVARGLSFQPSSPDAVAASPRNLSSTA
jgi:hypothetical protein